MQRNSQPLKPGVHSQPVPTAGVTADNRAGKRSGIGSEPKCHCCGLPCGLFTRFHFLVPRSSQRKVKLSRD